MSERNDDDDHSILLELIQRVTRVEERLNSFERRINSLERRISRVDSRLWWILGSVILGILLTLLTRFL